MIRVIRRQNEAVSVQTTLPDAAASAELRARAGEHFDADVIEALLAVA